MEPDETESAGHVESETGAEAEGLAVEGGRLESIIESLLLASDRPLATGDLKKLLGERDGKKVTAAVEALADRRKGTGVHVVAIAGGWALRTNPENAPWVGKLLQGRPIRLSRAMMETLAIVAYRQPVTRPEIDEIRGVDCGPVLGTLLDRGLVRIIGKKAEVGRPLLYSTTPEFLRTFSLRDLAELPTLRDFHELAAEERARVDAEAQEQAQAPGARTSPPQAGLATHDPEDGDRDDKLLDELEQAALAATRAVGPVPEPDAPSS